MVSVKTLVLTVQKDKDSAVQGLHLEYYLPKMVQLLLL